MPKLEHPVRVVHLGKYYPPHRGGMETYLQTLCDRLRPDWDVRAIVAHDGFRSEESCVDGVPVSRMGTLFSLAAAPVCPAMVSKVRQSGADLVHIHVPNPGAVMAFLASGLKCPVVVSYHSDTVRQKILGRIFLPILERLLDRSAAIIVTSPNYIESSPVLAKYQDRCRVIPFGIDTTHLERFQSQQVGRLRERYGSKIVLSVGRLVYYKGFEYAIRAMRDTPETHLIIIGEGPLRSQLTALIRSEGLDGRVHLLGNVEDLAPYYQAASLFLLPSIARSEAFGIVQLEAMACSKPVVNTALASGVPYVSLDGITGITVPPKDAGALAGAMQRLLNNPGLRAIFGQAARRRLEAEFTLEGMVQRTAALYAEILNQAPARPITRTAVSSW